MPHGHVHGNIASKHCESRWACITYVYIHNTLTAIPPHIPLNSCDRGPLYHVSYGEGSVLCS